MKTNPFTLSTFKTGILLAAMVLSLNLAQATDDPAGLRSVMKQLAATVSRLAQPGPGGTNLPDANLPVLDSSSISVLSDLTPPPPPASLVESYWPMHDGDWRDLEATISGQDISLNESFTYDSWEDLFLLSPDDSGSFSFRYENGDVVWYALDAGGISLWFDTPVIFLKGSALPSGGNWTATTTSSYGGVVITLRGTFSISVAGTITIPLGTFSDCRKMTLSLTVSAQGHTETVSSEAFMLAPGIGYIQEAVLDTSFKFRGWANLTSGEVGGISVPLWPNLDTTPPSLVLTSPKAGQRCSNEWFVVIGTASDNVAVTNVSVQVNGTGWNDAASLNNWATWSYSAQLIPGANTIMVSATDSSGNTSLATATVVYVLSDRITLRINPPGAGTISGVADGQMCEIGRNITATANPAQGWAFSNWTGGTAVGPLAILTNKPALQFMMVSNLILQANFIDIKGPDLAITNPAPSGIRVSNAFVDVKGWSKDNDRVAGVWVKLNQGDFLPAQTANNWANWMLPQQQLVPGTNWLFARAIDLTGNSSATVSNRVIYVVTAPLNLVIVGKGTVTGAADGQPFEIGKQVLLKATPATGYVLTNWLVQADGVTLISTNQAVGFVMQSNLVVQATFADVKRPVLTITAPKSKQRWSNEVFTVTGKVVDNGPVAGVWYQLGTNDWTLAASNDGWTNWNARATLVPGPNTLRACAVDMAGNRSLTNPVTFTYVLSAPVAVQITGQGTVSPKDGTMLEIGKAVSVKATAGKGSMLTNWTVEVGGVPVISTNRAVAFVMQSNLVVRATFADVAKPTCAITAPKPAQRSSNAVFAVTGTARDNTAVTGVWYQLNANDWALASTSNGWTNWTVNVTPTPGANTVRAYAEDAAGNRSLTNSVSQTYVKTFTLADYYPLPLGADWLYGGTDENGTPTKFRFSVTSTNYLITMYRGRSPVISYTTNCVRVSAAFLDWTTLVPYDTWEEYMALGGRYGSFGDDDLPNESLRVAGGFMAPAQMAVGSSVTLKADAYMFGTNIGAASITFQLIENTSLTVPAGTFPDVLHMRWTFTHPGGSQTHDEWWARSVGKIKRLFISGDNSAGSYELIQYSLPVGSNPATMTALDNVPTAPDNPLEFKGSDGSVAVANGLLQMRLNGPSGAVVIIESSPDLVHWLPIQTNTVSVDGLSLSVPKSTAPAQFFRARLP